MHEYVACNHCQGRLSHSSKHSQFFYHTSATALRNEMADDVNQGLNEADSLGSYLARVERQMQKTCDEDEGTIFTAFLLGALSPEFVFCPHMIPSIWYYFWHADNPQIIVRNSFRNFCIR